MPTKKSTSRKVSMTKVVMAPSEVQNSNAENMPTARKPISPVIFLLPIIIAVLALIVWKNKGWIVAATVNNQPIWRWDLEGRLVSRYGTQTLDEMVNEQILKSEAAKQGITVTDADVNSKISEIEKSLNGKISLQDALAQQGMTMADLRQQAEIQVYIDKLTASKVTVSDKDVTDYIANNKDSLTATDEAGMRQEAKQAILTSKRNQTFQQIFANSKKSAKVTKFL